MLTLLYFVNDLFDISENNHFWTSVILWSQTF